MMMVPSFGVNLEPFKQKLSKVNSCESCGYGTKVFCFCVLWGKSCISSCFGKHRHKCPVALECFQVCIFMKLYQKSQLGDKIVKMCVHGRVRSR